MPGKSPTYRRLTRPTSSVGSYKSLWLAPDHLLIVTSTGYSEEYSRIELRNIKGLFILDSDRRMFWALPWVILAVFSAIILINTLFSNEHPYVSGTFLSVALLALLWNYSLGPGCSAHVVTGVQTARLPSVVRRRKARKVLASLLPAIREIQADVAIRPPAEPPSLPPAEPPPP